MPSFIVQIPGLEHTIERPVVISAIRKIQNITRLPTDIEIKYKSSIDSEKEIGSTIQIQDQLTDTTSGKLSLIVDEDYVPEQFTTTSLTLDDNMPIFLNNKDLKIIPIYTETRVSIKADLSLDFQTDMKRWIDGVRTKLSQHMDNILLELDYSYVLPKPVMSLLKHVYTLEENIAPYNRTFQEYIRDMSDGNLDWVSDIVSKHVDIVNRVKQVRVIGRFGYEPTPNKIESTSKVKWQTSFTFTFRYLKPISLRVYYPIMVHNQLLDKQYVELSNKVSDHFNDGDFSNYANQMALFELQYPSHISKVGYYLKTPAFDDYILPNTRKGTTTIFTALCQLSKDDKKSLLNLENLGDIFLDNDILTFLKKDEYDFVYKTFASVFFIEVLVNDCILSEFLINLDDKLNLKSLKDLNLRDTYRVRFSVVNDFTCLTERAKEVLKNNPVILGKIITMLNCSFGKHPVFQDRNVKITNKDFELIQKAIRDMRTNLYTGLQNTVLSSGIIAFRKE